MAYSDFTVGKVKQSFGIVTVEGDRFLPEGPLVRPSAGLVTFLEEALE